MNKILMIHSGGTLGMIKYLGHYKTQKGNLGKLLLSNPNIANESLLSKEANCNSFESRTTSFVTPVLHDGQVAVIHLYEFEEILDSSSASPKDWCAIADLISIVYDKYKAFVIIHGTDTLSYAASCLCFLLESLTVPVVFTASILPMVVEGSDAERNIIGAIKSCLLIERPGVYLYFNGWLHHGARTTKISSDAFDSFYSTNPIRIEDLEKCSVSHTFSEKLRNHCRPLFHSKMSSEVGILKIHPAMNPSHFKATLDAYKAVILETYGSGTFPANRTDLTNMMKTYTKNGGVIVSVSQCADGNVSDIYQSSSILSEVGVISAKNMTTEAAFAKLSFLLANRKDEVEECFSVSFCGEINERATDTRNYKFNNYTRAFLL